MEWNGLLYYYRFVKKTRTEEDVECNLKSHQGFYFECSSCGSDKFLPVLNMGNTSFKCVGCSRDKLAEELCDKHYFVISLFCLKTP